MPLSKKQQRESDQAQQIVDKFNNLYPVGSIVSHRKGTHSSYPYENRELTAKAYVSASLEPIAFFAGLSGYYSIKPEFIQY